MTTDNRYLHLIRQDCPLPPGTHVVIYCRDSGGDEQDRSVTQQIDSAREYCQHHNLVINIVPVQALIPPTPTPLPLTCTTTIPAADVPALISAITPVRSAMPYDPSGLHRISGGPLWPIER